MLFGVSKRLLVGRPVQSDRLGHTLLPKKIALPVFASDALSSVAYATEEILIVLSAGGIALIAFTPWIAVAVGVLMLVVVGALMVDDALAGAVSVSSGVANLASAFPSLDSRVTLVAVVVVAVIAL